MPAPPGGPPILPVLVLGSRIREWPFGEITVTEEMVRDRQRENDQITRTWNREQERQRHVRETPGEFFGDFKDDKVRRRFIRRVFAILTLQLMFTAGVIAAFILIKEVQAFAHEYDYLGWVAFGVWLVTYVGIVYSDCGKEDCCSFIFLILLTASTAYMAAEVSTYYSTNAVILAAGTTALNTLTITSIATCTKFDLTKYKIFLGILALVMFVVFVTVIVLAYFDYVELSTLELALGTVGTIGFSIFLFYHVQLIMGGRKEVIEPHQTVYAAAIVYTDIIMIYESLLSWFNYCGY